jgi:hypothetical protein
MPTFDLIWINRIGIILNFVAGFLMAPDLIGTAKLRELEFRLERKLDNILEDFRATISLFENPFRAFSTIWPAAGRFTITSRTIVAFTFAVAGASAMLWGVFVYWVVQVSRHCLRSLGSQ